MLKIYTDSPPSKVNKISCVKYMAEELNSATPMRSTDGDTNSMFLFTIRETIDWPSHVKSHGETSGCRSVLDGNKSVQLLIIQLG